MHGMTRRSLLQAGTALGAGLFGVKLGAGGAEPATEPAGVQVLSPRGRVPLSFIIDDSTCLVNMGAYCMPQFAATWPNRAEYKKPWKQWPREIPDSFVREFGEWCGEHGVKGKYSLVPYPACVGWLDRELPGWSRQELSDSLKLVRELMLPNWDIHPEMVTHTRVIDVKTGRPLEKFGPGEMENWYPHGRKSVDELAEYIAYALRILKNCQIPCEGITTPGGFGNLQKRELALAVKQAVSEVFAAEIPHYFKYVIGGNESTQPKLEHVEGAVTDNPRLVVNVPAGTGDWFGGWDGDLEPEGHRYVNDDATDGRMVELIERGEPAVMLCHWAGLFTHGTKKGFEHFKKVVVALDGRYRDRTLWMKLSEIARYWAARDLTRIWRAGKEVTLDAPFACPAFTLRVPDAQGPVRQEGRPLEQVRERHALRAGTWLSANDGLVICLDLARGRSILNV